MAFSLLTKPMAATLTPVRQMSRPEIAGWLGVLILSLSLTLQALISLWGQWQGNASLSHGPLLLLITGGLLWLRRSELRWDAADWRGFVILALSAFLLVAAVWLDISFLKPLSFLGMAAGGSWFLGGVKTARTVAAALGLLVWAIPWPTTFSSMLSFPLQLTSSAYAGLFAGVLGLPIHREGVHLSVMGEVTKKPIYSILVAAECSGMASLMVLLAFGYLVAYFSPVRWWARIALFASVVPLALLANAVRLTIILLVGGLYSAKAAQIVHDNEQPFLIFLCSLGLMGIRHLLLQWAPLQPTARRTSTPQGEAVKAAEAVIPAGELRNTL